MKLSITLATFNVEKYIHQCLDSIIHQTYTDFELICIDDGSVDNTVRILKEYASIDSRIRLNIKERNEGLAVARNESLSMAQGEFITFLDGDDYYDLSLFEKAIAIAEKENSDMVIWDFLAFELDEQVQIRKQIPSELLKINISNRIELLKRPAFTGIKIIRTQVARDLGIYFPEGKTRQDIPVHWVLSTKLKNISVLPERLSYYRQQPEATTAKKDKRLFDLVYVMDIVLNYLIENNILDTYKNQFYLQQLNFLHGMYDRIEDQYKKEALNLIKDRLKEEHIAYIKNTNYVRPQTKFFLLSLNGSKWNTFKLWIWRFTRAVYRKIKPS